MTTARTIKVIILLLTIAVSFWLNHSKNNSASDDIETVVKNDFSFNYAPSSTTGVIIKHSGYQLSYSEKHEQAEWVAYSLHKNDIVYTNHERPFFINDPKVRTQSADWRSYKNSGYDKGHLCPAGDKRYSKKAHDETFFTSNITPQKHDFNAGIWNKLEQKTRYWAKKYHHLYVITGGVLEPNLKTIGNGKNKVSVPNKFYKILLDYTEPEIKAIAFLMPHQDSAKPLSSFVVSIDSIEQLTGIDFFPQLPDSIENKLEASTNYKNWSFR